MKTDRMTLGLGSAMAGIAFIAMAASPAQAAVQPSAGIYSDLGYVSKVEVTGKGTCPYNVGQYLNGYFTYPGPGKTGAIRMDQIETSTDNFVEIVTFPKTPAAGVESWSGSYSYKYLPDGGPTGTGTFTWKFGFVNANAFIATRTDTFAITGGKCTITVNDSAVRIGS
jgi:hypothetical protein